jgi:hypothetical protein
VPHLLEDLLHQIWVPGFRSLGCSGKQPSRELPKVLKPGTEFEFAALDTSVFADGFESGDAGEWSGVVE